VRVASSVSDKCKCTLAKKEKSSNFKNQFRRGRIATSWVEKRRDYRTTTIQFFSLIVLLERLLVECSEYICILEKKQAVVLMSMAGMSRSTEKTLRTDEEEDQQGAGGHSVAAEAVEAVQGAALDLGNYSRQGHSFEPEHKTADDEQPQRREANGQKEGGHSEQTQRGDAVATRRIRQREVINGRLRRRQQVACAGEGRPLRRDTRKVGVLAVNLFTALGLANSADFPAFGVGESAP